jgi:hypothetical protein
LSVPDPAAPLRDRRLPPVAEGAVVSLALVAVAVIYQAAYLPRRAPLAPAIVLVALSALSAVGAGVLAARVRGFAWGRFRLVFVRALAGYAVIAGMLEYVFVYDHTPGTLLALLTISLVIFAIDVPVILAFSVARYQPFQAVARPIGQDTPVPPSPQ